MPDIVIARYNEDVSWIEHIPEQYNIHLYEKGMPLDIGASSRKLATHTTLPNIGRESDTYLHHLLHHMQSNESFTVFTQGDPFEHSPNFLSLLHYPFDTDIWGYASQWKSGLPPEHLITEHLVKTGEPTRNETFSLFNWAPIYSPDIGAMQISEHYAKAYKVPKGINIAADFFHRIGYAEAMHRAQKAAIGQFAYAALFGVRNSIAKRIPKEILAAAANEVRTQQIGGYIMERLWLHFFGHPFFDITSI